MTFEEILKGNGMADEAVEKVKAALKENKIYFSGEENIDIRFNKLKSQSDEQNKLIEELKKASSGSEEAKTKVAEYEKRVADLEAKLKAETIDNKLKVALLSAGVQDVDYLTFKLKEGGEELSLDDKGEIRGLKDRLSELKTKYPSQFASGEKKVEENKLPDGKDQTPGGAAVTKEQFDKMGYAERVKLFETDKEAYDRFTNGSANTNSNKEAK